jgi:hypothetical protein
MNNSNFVIEDGVLKKYCGNEENVVVPFGVTTIGKQSFAFNKQVKSVIIPNSVTEIKDTAFYRCNLLTKIVIPYSVTKIEELAFGHCECLKDVYISDLTSWCNIDFNSYTGNPLSYAKNLYLNKKIVEELVIPNNVSTIKDYVFEFGTFSKVIIPDGVTNIKGYAFYGCNFIESITVPSSTKNIGDSAFAWCESLSKVFFEGECETIGGRIFQGCTELKEIYVYSENTKQLLEDNYNIPDGCKIIVDPLLSKNKSDITLGANFLNNESENFDSSEFSDFKNPPRDDR